MAKQGRNYTREFRVEAVRRIATQGKSLAEFARQLGPGLGQGPLRGREVAFAAKHRAGLPRRGRPPGRRRRTASAPRRGPPAPRGTRQFKKATTFFARESS